MLFLYVRSSQNFILYSLLYFLTVKFIVENSLEINITGLMDISGHPVSYYNSVNSAVIHSMAC